MFIRKVDRFYRKQDGTVAAYDYYHLTKSYRDAKGKKHNRCVLGMGRLEEFTRGEREELADMLTVMIEKGQCVMHENIQLYEKAIELYAKYRESKYARENDPILIAEAERKKREAMLDAVTIKISSLTQHEARSIGRENLCHSTLRMLKIREYLTMRGWDRMDIDIALMQIIARAIYPYSELKTVRYLRENTALAEMFKVPKEKITKDVLYRSALRLWEEHRGLEDWLHERVCDMFNIEEKILLFDITNTYFEGRYDKSEICRYGRSKEKRSDCKIVVLAAVVNTEGLLVRTSIYEGNRHDSTTLKDVVGSVSTDLVSGARRIVVMDAGFYSAENVKWLTDNGFDYITVLPSAETRFTPSSTKWGGTWRSRKVSRMAHLFVLEFHHESHSMLEFVIQPQLAAQFIGQETAGGVGETVAHGEVNNLGESLENRLPLLFFQFHAHGRHQQVTRVWVALLELQIDAFYATGFRHFADECQQ